MFNIPRPNVIESDEGFSIEVLGRTGLKYSQGGRILMLDSEILAGPSEIVIYKSSIVGWNPPHDQEILDDKLRDEIIDNIKRAFHFRNIEMEII